MLKEILAFVVAGTFLGLVVIGGIWWNVATYNECRESEHSVMYCLRMVSK